MDRRFYCGASSVLLGLLVGCGSSTTETAKTPSSRPATTADVVRAPQEQPIVEVTQLFLEAVIQGDSERAMSHMTPQAIEQMRTSGEAFSPPSWETATFKIGQIRMPNESQAVVQCFFQEATPSGTTEEEMCCMLKHVGGRWGVSGVAFQISPDKAPYLLNFEQPPQNGPTQQQMADFPMTPPADDVAPATPDGYRTAAQPDAPAPR